MTKRKISLILDNIRSAHNVGSIFRTADATGVSHIYFTGYTPRPYDGTLPYTTKPERGIIKTALGAEKFVDWSFHENIDELLRELKDKNVKIVGLEQDKRSIDYLSYDFSGDIALILGNEPKGIDSSVLSQCDDIIEIPMLGKKQSLNVSVATGVALYALIR